MGGFTLTFWLAFPFFGLAYYFPGIFARQKRWWLLLLASASFVGFREPRALLVLGSVAIVSYLSAAASSEAGQSAKGRFWYWAGCVAVVAELLILRETRGWISIGLAFYSLQALGYLTDVRRGVIRHERNFWLYLTSLSCFAYVSAGPVVRAREMIAQLRNPEPLTDEAGREAVFRICLGLTKKAMGDCLASLIRFPEAGPQTSFTWAWISFLAIAARFYVDFSGYTDIAIGVGRLVGLRLPENFRAPYLSKSVLDHWRRWHMSLGQWAMEYLFMPLSLVRLPRVFDRLPPGAIESFRLGLGLFGSFLVIGIWHGATWGNLIWGFYNATLIAIGFLLGGKWRVFKTPDWLKVCVVFYLVTLGRIFNLAPTLGASWRMVRTLHEFGGIRALQPIELVDFFFLAAALFTPHWIDSWLSRNPVHKLSSRWIWCAIGALILAYFLLGAGNRPFLYEG